MFLGNNRTPLELLSQQLEVCLQSLQLGFDLIRLIGGKINPGSEAQHCVIRLASIEAVAITFVAVGGVECNLGQRQAGIEFRAKKVNLGQSRID